MHKSTIKTIGLTGGIGSGKTVATTTLIKHGYAVVDADEVSRTLFKPYSAGEKLIADIFPSAVINGRLDRKALRKIIADDESARQKLNAVTHPAIIAEIKRMLNSTPPPVILSAPLLFESGLDELCDTVVCVHCPLPVQIQRICKRDGIDEHAARAIISAQMDDDLRKQKSDYLVNSDVPIDEFENTILTLISDIVKANDDQ